MAGPRVALALGSGGARGYAHIGVIQTLQQQGYEIVAIAGASMGALIGGLHAAGKLADYTEWVTSLSQFDVVRLLDPSVSSPGALRADKVFGRVHELVGDVTIEDLPIPFTAVATDLRARKEVWFQRGSLYAAMRASIAIPGVFAPVVLDGRLLADGGLMNPVPVAPTIAVRSDLTIAVDLGGERAGPEDDGDTGAQGESEGEVRTIDEWADRFRRGAANLFDRDMFRALTRRAAHSADRSGDEPDATPELPPAAAATDPAFGELPKGLSKFTVMNQSLEAVQHVLTRYRLAGSPPDVVLSVPKDACRTGDFHRAAEMIDLGRSLAWDALAPLGGGGDEPGPGR